MRGGSVTDSPSNVGVPRLCVGVPLCCLPCGFIEWRGGMCCDAPCSDWVWHFTLSVPLHIVCSPRIVPVPLLSCVAVFVVCGGGTVSRSALLFPLCVCCHSIVGLVLCLCDRAVSLWNGGGAMGV